jgi:hypothetical protein
MHGCCSIGFVGEEAGLLLCKQFLGAFTKWQKVTISLAVSVHLSVHMEQLGSHWTDFHEI